MYHNTLAHGCIKVQIINRFECVKITIKICESNKKEQAATPLFLYLF